MIVPSAIASLPLWLRDVGPWNLAWWQWIALVILVLAAPLFGRLGAAIVLRVLRRVTAQTRSDLDDAVLSRARGPLRLAAAMTIVRAAMPALALPGEGAIVMRTGLLAGFAAAVTWMLLRLVDLFVARASTAAWAERRPGSRALLVLVARIGKVIVIVITAIAVLGSLGIPVASLLAGLGIGGIALAFGAQKTVENLFGALALGVDQPLREGDYVKVEADVTGTVESVGLRSTRIRTADRTIVTLPNGRLADMRIETFAPRDRCRFTTTLGLVYSTSAAQLRAVRDGVERVLAAHPQISPEGLEVRLAGLGASSLDLEVSAWFQTTDYTAFKRYREDVLLAFLDVIERAGSALAYPTRTVQVVQAMPPLEPPRATS